MRYLLCIQLLFCISIANAKNYYISSKGFDTNTGLTSATPWKSIANINTTIFRAGDSILFKRGELFYGTLTPATSGITFAAYGTGANPIITGLTTISAWTSLGGNIWEATVPGGLPTLNMVIINGVLTPMGRYPNFGTTNSGYLTYDSWVGSTSLTCKSLTGTPDYSGAEVVVRRQGYTTDRAKIISQNGNTLTYRTIATESLRAGFGFFIQNSPAVLDKQNEWFYYDVSGTKKIKIYSTSNPGNVQVATLNNLVNMVYNATAQKSNITFKGIDFKGSEGTIFMSTYTKNCSIEDCNFSFGGVSAIEYRFSTYLTIKNCNISDINMCGIYEYFYNDVSNIVVKNNNLKRIGINPGMIAPVSSTYPEGNSSTGIIGGSENLNIRENVLDIIVYNGITLSQNRNNNRVTKNIISNWCMVKNDGGGIYNVGQRGLPAASNVIIDSNIIFKSVGETGGSPNALNKHVKGIYLDATSQSVKVLNNTVFDCFIGISISEAQNNTIKHNTVYNCGIFNPEQNYFAGQLNIDDGAAGFVHCSGNIITNNIFFAKKPKQLLYLHNDNFNRLDSIGIIDSNYNAMPFGKLTTHATNKNSSIANYSFGYWQSKYPMYNKHSKISPITVPQYTEKTIGVNKAPNELFTSDINNLSSSSTPTVHTLSWDNTSKITGIGSAKLTTKTSSSNFTNFYQIIGPVDADKGYILRFKTKATKVGLFKTYLQQWSGSYSIITSSQAGTVDTTIQEHEIAFSGEHSTQLRAAIIIQFSQDSSTIYIDDVQFYEASLTNTNIDDFLRFEYNPTNSAKIISLNGTYMGVDSTVYNNTITLQPFTSIILLKSNKSAATLRVDAGNDISIILPANTAVLNGSASGEIKKYEWLKTDGPKQYLIENSNNPITKISNLTMGKYTFQLKVFNSAGDSAISLVNVVLTSILPVKLSDFLGKSINEKVALQWLSESESNVDHYAIQRSSDGHIFENIGAVKSKNIYSARAIYYYDDLTPAKGINYYRLAMVDKDGTTNYSKTILVSVSKVPSFTLLNTDLSATNSYIRIGLNSNYQQSLNIAVIDVSGRVLVSLPLQIQKGFNEIYREMPALNTGVYYIKLLTKDQSITRAVVSDN